MLTRDEASQVWCPMTRQARHEPDDPQAPSGGAYGNLRAVGGCNTGGLGARVPASCRCIADKCAMWRWGGLSDDEKDRLHASLQHGGKSISEELIKSPWRGYCGMAGRPV